MNDMTIFPLGGTKALPVAVRALQAHGAKITEKPTAETTHLMLPVPSFDPDGTVRGGGNLEQILKLLPQTVAVLGGKLTDAQLAGYEKVDLLCDEQYLAENAALTAECALRIAGNLLPVRLQGLPVLVIGWGRIGKCLAQQLQRLGAKTCVAARKQTDRAMIRALGCEALTMEQMKAALSRQRLIFNTVPAPVLTRDELRQCAPDCIKIDLASVCGMDGADVITARGLPGKHLPESSGQLIADTVMRLLREKEGAL